MKEFLVRYFKENLKDIEEGLKIVEKDEIIPQSTGDPDLTCEDRSGNYVVVVIAEAAGYEALGKIISYKSAAKRKTGKKVRGILLSFDFDQKISAAKSLKDEDGVGLVEFKRCRVIAEDLYKYYEDRIKELEIELEKCKAKEKEKESELEKIQSLYNYYYKNTSKVWK